MVGADADIAIWDPSRRVTITQDLMLHGSDYTPYEGIEVVGWPITTLLRGKVIADGGVVIGEAGDGQFLKRTVTPPPFS
jgi:dihydropyrimidinase